MNRDVFFKEAKPLFGSYSQSQVDGISALLDAFEYEGVADKKYQAYMLATTFHETDRTMQPIKELGGRSYFMKMYDVSGSRPKMARDNGNVNVGDGAKYYGRGFVQLTWHNNYLRAGRKLGIDLVGSPDLALQPDVAAKILCAGMIEGWFTGKRLVDYLGGMRTDWVNARRIINGTDKAEPIARYALKFYDALIKAA